MSHLPSNCYPQEQQQEDEEQKRRGGCLQVIWPKEIKELQSESCPKDSSGSIAWLVLW